MSDRIWMHVLPPETRSLRMGAFVGLAILTGTYLFVLYETTIVVATPWRFLLVSGAAVVAAVGMAGAMSTRGAAHLTVIGSVIAFAVYIHLVPGGWAFVLSGTSLVGDVVILAMGTTILSIVSVDLWVLAVAPGPVFLSWYLAIESRYAAAAGVGISPVVFLVLTGDLGSDLALLGVVAAVAVVGCGELAWMRARVPEVDLLAMVIACMLIASLAITVVPATDAQFSTPEDPEDDPGITTEASFVETDGSMTITGSPSLSPEVRYTIEADQPANWRVDGYDRYTGDGWVQSGEGQPFQDVPATGEDESVLEVQAEIDGIERMPALYEPRTVDGVTSVVQTPEDGLRTGNTINAGDTYRVTSVEPNATAETGDDDEWWTYDSDLEDRYTQLPSDTPDRVETFTSELTANASSPLEAAVIVEQYIIQSNEYSLDVSAPSGDIADEQIFERDAGYCAYFATTMAVMLRTQDIPARMVTGYSTGEQVDEDRWVVRGMNAHAWVEVYIPGTGWVEFDPTPSAPYDDVREDVLEEARDAGDENVDTEESGQGWSPPETNETDAAMTEEEIEAYCDDSQAVMRGNISVADAVMVCSDDEIENMAGIGANQTMPTDQEQMHLYRELAARTVGDSAPQEQPEEDDLLPPVEWMGIGLGLGIGAVASMRRLGVTRKLHYGIAVRWQGSSGDPIVATIRAWDRLEMYLAREYAPRESNESVRQYLARLDRQYPIDARTIDVAKAYERARYGEEELSPEIARETVATVDDVVGRSIDSLGR